MIITDPMDLLTVNIIVRQIKHQTIHIYSAGSDYGLSSSVEKQYMFKRDQSGHTPNFSNFLDNLGEGEAEFEMDINVGPSALGAVAVTPPSQAQDKRLRRMDSVYDTSSLSSEDVARLNSCLYYILNIVGETVAEYTIKETIVQCQYDGEAALNKILEGGAARSSSPQSSPPKRSRVRAEEELEGKEKVTPVVKQSPVSLVGFQAERSVKPDTTVMKVKADHGRSRSHSPLPSRLETLSIETPKKGEVGEHSAGPAATPQKQVVMRKQEVDVRREYQKLRGDCKESINLIVIGHVDSGKSTLMGHLLFQLGQVSQKMLHKYEQESRKLGKQSFMYAWVLDETEEERSRGITMDVGQNKFETEHRVITLLDAPGHRDFIPNMISGAYQADVAILVVNATTGEFEAGFDSGGQTREHALLVRSLGVSQLCVAINKLDTVDWDQARFTHIKEKLRIFLTKQAGFKETDLSFVPCSGLTGENLGQPPTSDKLRSWYSSGPTLVEVVDTMKTPVRAMEKPFRLAISDIFRAQTGSGWSVAGRVEAGLVMKEDRLMVSPLLELATVKSVDLGLGFAGDHVVLTVTGPDQNSVNPGMVLCDPANLVPVTNRFQARVVIFNIEMPITKGEEN